MLLIPFATCPLLIDENKRRRRRKQALNLPLAQAEKIAFAS
jgi:hypothetical protein